jgi:arabinofuranosyltransferase
LAITDGFLARIPPIYNPNWRSGHFMRIIPDGYVEVEAGVQEHLDDLTLDAYFQKIRLVTEGPLFSAERWQAIWELNTRNFEDWLPGYSVRLHLPNLQRVELETMPDDKIQLDISFAGQGSAAQVDFAEIIHAEVMKLELSAGDNFELIYLDSEGEEIESQQILSQLNAGVEAYSIRLPGNIAEQGFAALRLAPIRVFYEEADGDYLWSTLQFGQ